MEVTIIPKRTQKKFVDKILDMYASGEISAGKASETLGISRAAFYQLLAEKKVSLPKKLQESIRQELKNLKQQ